MATVEEIVDISTLKLAGTLDGDPKGVRDETNPTGLTHIAQGSWIRRDTSFYLESVTFQVAVYFTLR